MLYYCLASSLPLSACGRAPLPFLRRLRSPFNIDSFSVYIYMGALGTLGIGLSVLFGLFLAVLAGEIYYMLCCRRGRLGAGSNSRRVSSVQVVEAQAAAAATEMGGFAREAAMVGSFGGYPTTPYQSEFVSKFFPPSVDCTHISPLDGILFTIAEETKEEMELHAGNAKDSDNNPVPSNLACDSKPVVDALSPTDACASVTISFTEASACASSTSVSFSVTPEATPFGTPPSSPSSSDTSSDGSLSPSSSPATAASQFSAYSGSPASASTSPATAVSRFSFSSLSPSSTAASPATANSRFSAATSPVSIAVSPVATRLSVVSPASTSPASQRSSVDASSYVYGDRGPLGALFRRSYNSPSRYSPLRPVVWSGQITDFRHALPFSPPNPQFFMNC